MMNKLNTFNNHLIYISNWCIKMVNVNLGAYYEEIIHKYISKGYAGSKVEILRMAIREFDEREKRNIIENEKIKQFVAQNANQDIWNDPKEDKVWNKYIK